MDYNNIETLLEKYWEGAASLAEEQTLRDYFNSGNVDPKFAEAAPLFQFFKTAKDNQLPESFEAKLTAKLESLEQKKDTPPIQQSQQTARRIPLFTKVASIAALLALALCISIFTSEPKVIEKQPLAWEDTYEDPEKAYEETLAALKLISKKLNRGKKETARGLLKVKEKTNFKKK